MSHSRPLSSSKYRLVSWTSWIVIVALNVLVLGCGSDRTPTPLPESSATKNAQQTDPAAADSASDSESRLAYIKRVQPRVQRFCGDCHAMPLPSSSPHDEWEHEVNQGFMLYGMSGRSDLEVPPYDEVLNYFQYQAPDQLSIPGSIAGYAKSKHLFKPQAIRLSGNRPPGTTHIDWIDLGFGGGPALVYCDIGTGAVKACWPNSDNPVTKQLGVLFQPVHVEPCDLDQDGSMDLLACDIGEFDADDSHIGRLVWLRQDPPSHRFDRIELQTGLSRIADARPGDFDGDGDTDLLVAEFGWRKSGQIKLLENLGWQDDEKTSTSPQWKTHPIDPRHGTIHVPPIDIDHDGDLDFVALISQEHETVEVFLNQGGLQFEKQVLWQAPDPAYGSSGIELVDLDGDGDSDVLMSNGDSFDRGPKQYHSVQWLENPGKFPWVHHHLCDLPGVMSARSIDVDGDGDLDIVAAALLAGPTSERLQSSELPSILILEQRSDGLFEVTRGENSAHYHATLETGDFNGDGKVDFATGNLLREPGKTEADVVIWWNQR
ncbi:VCBS repeat-containing protein [Stieleria sp. TO1_6]|uniref:FG-GAP repeat domain-containing protein n=1 Tax=Stieleria tagensis TaxID=2956795 RepID=UPI00209AA0AF|nr:VCBS repeat-containing protein [Stieleria tagensis]MCO8120193.1 VCBS repeat-containing protein [Stieleria tagensis]